MTVIRKANLAEYPEFDGAQLRIIQLSAENIKKIKLVEIKPHAGINIVSGPNGSGKSSLLDCIMFALRGSSKITTHTIRNGTERATIKLDLGEIVVIRKLSRGNNKAGYLEVWSKDAKTKYRGGQQLLDALLGAISFDPLEFMGMKAEDQLDTLRTVAPVDIDIPALDAANKADYDIRRNLTRTNEALKVKIADAREPEGTPAERVDVEGLARELQEAGEHNAQREQVHAQVKSLFVRYDQEKGLADVARLAAKNLRAEAERLMESAARRDAEAEEHHREAQAAVDAADAMTVPEATDTEPIQQRIAEAAALNRRVDQRERREALEREKAETDAEVARLSAAMDERTRQRTEAIAAAKMPVEGLGYGDGEVMYKDIPFGQLSDGEQIKISVQIAMATNPTIRVLRIKDGSLLDDASMRQIEEMANAHNYQMFVERVDTSGKVGIVMEEGEVVSDGELGK